ncbi:SDR family NAD(P)-dependent oxidoreductase [Bacillus sp. FJAT-49711]|uniref:SDR family NAD(P)-dependent oxidoreductase n=1 Tax=Bacillus sp. FJAT-49711 TaxID=2833585 RepID=UPI001BC900F0|nr:SDR family NAD(P)-dependent oxidoreductase [Bacillus sp. FJAT-49711]MBS4218276.1 SDR family NAD(P)-dependent oxidoreductase [Bacillus sp. FJAT-49711]
MNYIILTGASRGIGEALCKKLLSNHNHLLCVSRKKNHDLISIANSKKHNLDYFEFDLNNTYEIEELMKNIFVKIDSSVMKSLYLINNAGVHFSQNIKETEPDSIINMMNVNLISPMILTSSFIKQSEQYDIEKRILNVSSGASFNLSPGGSWYSTSKAGLETFTKSVGIEKSDVKIMAVRPGMVDTYMHRNTENKKVLKTPEYAADRILTFLFERFEHGKAVKAW